MNETFGVAFSLTKSRVGVAGFLPAIAALALLASPSASLARILQPTAISSTFGSFAGNPLENIINQSGLTAGYTSGATDFDAFAAATTHDQTSGTLAVGFTDTSGLPQEFTFDLGDVFSVDAVGFWGFDEAGVVTSFDLFSDDDDDIGNGTGPLIGAFNPVIQPSANVFSFAPTATRFFHLVATDTNIGLGAFPGIGEVAFRGVPEPNALCLSLCGLGVLGVSPRRRDRCEAMLTTVLS